jgi:hypothetical protein
MAGRTITRDQGRYERRHAFYLQKIAEAPSDTAKVSRACDYVTALLAEQPDQPRREIAERVVADLVAVAVSLHPASTRKGGRR